MSPACTLSEASYRALSYAQLRACTLSEATSEYTYSYMHVYARARAYDTPRRTDTRARERARTAVSPRTGARDGTAPYGVPCFVSGDVTLAGIPTTANALVHAPEWIDF